MSVCSECRGAPQAVACPQCGDRSVPNDPGAAPVATGAPQARPVSGEDRWDLSSVARLPSRPPVAVAVAAPDEAPEKPREVTGERPVAAARASSGRRPFRPAPPARAADALARQRVPTVDPVAAPRGASNETLPFARADLGIVEFRKTAADQRPSAPEAMVFERPPQGVVEHRPPAAAVPRAYAPANDVTIHETAPYSAVRATPVPKPAPVTHPPCLTLPELPSAPVAARAAPVAPPTSPAAASPGAREALAITAAAVVFACSLGLLADGAVGAGWAAYGVLVHAFMGTLLRRLRGR